MSFGAVAGTTAPTAVVGTSGAKGSWTTLGTANFDINVLILTVTQITAAQQMIDIGVNDGSGNVRVIAENLIMDGRYPPFRVAYTWTLPLLIPGGSILVARSQASTNNRNVGLVATGSSIGLRGMPGYRKCFPLYAITGTLPTTTPHDPGATANTLSAWGNAHTAPADVFALGVMINGGSDLIRGTSTVIRWLANVGASYGAGYRIVVPDILAEHNLQSGYLHPVWHGPISVYIPSGTSVAVQAQSSSNVAGDRALDILPYGFTN